MMEHEHENEVKTLKNRIEELEKQHKDMKGMVDKLKDKIECPVCMEIPRKGPVPVCPNGHFVCNKCKKESCPTCRSNMGSNKSILAGTIIDNIEHQCKFEECDEMFLLPNLEKHEEACPHRTVTCPNPNCTKKIALSKLLPHLLDRTSCREANTFVNLSNNKSSTSFNVDGDLTTPEMSWSVEAFSFEGMDFVVYPDKSKGHFYFVILMLGTEVQCSKYSVELEVHEEAIDPKIISFKFCGSPTSIDVEDPKLYSLGISEQSMKRVLDASEYRIPSFTLSYKLAKKK